MRQGLALLAIVAAVMTARPAPVVACSVGYQPPDAIRLGESGRRPWWLVRLPPWLFKPADGVDALTLRRVARSCPARQVCEGDTFPLERVGAAVRSRVILPDGRYQLTARIKGTRPREVVLLDDSRVTGPGPSLPKAMPRATAEWQTGECWFQHRATGRIEDWRPTLRHFVVVVYDRAPVPWAPLVGARSVSWISEADFNVTDPLVEGDDRQRPRRVWLRLADSDGHFSPPLEVGL